MKFKQQIILFVFAALFISCNKNEPASLIIGTWLHLSSEVNGQVIESPDSEESKLTFDVCEGNSEWCPAIQFYNGFTNDIEYQISEDGDYLTMRNLDGSQLGVVSIIELSTSTLRVSQSGQGITSISTYEKQ